MTEKVRENRLRRMAARNTEYRLIKSRRRDPRAIGYGCYELIHDGSAGGVFGLGSRFRTKAWAAGISIDAARAIVLCRTFLPRWVAERCAGSRCRNVGRMNFGHAR